MRDHTNVRDALDEWEASPPLMDRWGAWLRSWLALALLSTLLVGGSAVLYLHQVAQTDAANMELQTQRAEQVRLEGNEELLQAQLGQLTSPAYVDAQARKLGLQPAPLGSAAVITVTSARGSQR